MKSSFADLAIPDISFPAYMKQKFQYFGEDIALIDNTNGKSITFKELNNQTNKLSFALTRRGLKKGDIVGICAHNCVEYPIIFLSVLSCGAAVTTCDTSYTTANIFERFTTTEPRFVIFDNASKGKMREMAKDLSCIEELFSIQSQPDFTSIEEFIRQESSKENFTKVTIDPKEDVAAIYYSSGTTGPPKGVMITHRGFVSNTEIWRSQQKLFRSNCLYTDRALFHMYGWAGTCLSLAQGTKVVFDKKFQLEKLLQAIDQYKVTHLVVGLSAVTSLAKTSLNLNYDTSSLRLITCAGTVIPPKLLDEVGKKYQCIPSPMYGMTEFCPISVSHAVTFVTASNGIIGPNTRIKVCDDARGLEVNVGQVGSLLVKGPQMMKGYFKRPDLTSMAVDDEGWLRTGDVGFVDKDGMIYVIGRKKELIKHKDILIAPADLEAILLQHPLILAAGVIGVPDKEMGEVPRAYVVLKDHALNEDDVKRIIEETSSNELHLRGGVGFLDEIPITATGKIDRLYLLELYEKNV